MSLPPPLKRHGGQKVRGGAGSIIRTTKVLKYVQLDLQESSTWQIIKHLTIQEFNSDEETS